MWNPVKFKPRDPFYPLKFCQDLSWRLQITSRQPKGVKLSISKIANYDSSSMRGLLFAQLAERKIYVIENSSPPTDRTYLWI